MKTFKQHYAQDLKDVAWLEEPARFVFQKFSPYIQLSSTFLKTLKEKQERGTFFHVCDIENAIRVFETVEGTKKSISTSVPAPDATYEHADEYDSVWKSGIRGGGGIILKVKGNLVFGAQGDIMSRPDTNGRRWIQLKTIQQYITKENALEMDEFSEEIVEAQEEIFEDYVYPLVNAKKLDRDHGPKDIINALTTEQKQEAVEKYNKKCQEIMTRYKKLLQYFLAIRPEHTINDWNEYVVNEIEVKKVFLFDSKAEEMGIQNIYKLTKLASERDIQIVRGSNKELAGFMKS